MTNQTDLRQQFNLVSWASFLGACLLFGLSFFTNYKVVRLFMLGGSMANVGISSVAIKRKEWLDNEDQDLRDILSGAKKQKLLVDSYDFQLIGSEEIETEEEIEAEKTYKIFNVEDIKGESVHVAIFASSGSGKTLFLRHLLTEVFSNDQYVLIDPHSIEGSGLIIESKEHALQLLEDFAHSRLQKLIIGSGRDWQSINNFYSALEDHLSYRFQNGAESARWPQLSIVVEELPAIIKNLDLIEKDLVSSTNQSLLAESRKVGLRLIILTQADQVKGLGLAGMSSLKSAYMFIRLGTDAVKHAKQKKQLELMSLLNHDMNISFANHKASGSQNLFKGYCAMVNDDGYLPYLDLRKWSSVELDSDLKSGSYETRAPFGGAVGSGGVQGYQGVERVVEAPQVSPGVEQYNEFFGVARSIPQAKSEPTQTITVKVDPYWVARWKESPLHGYHETLRPKWLNDEHLAKFIKYKFEDGDTISRATKRIFTGEKYTAASKWFEMVMDSLKED